MRNVELGGRSTAVLRHRHSIDTRNSGRQRTVSCSKCMDSSGVRTNPSIGSTSNSRSNHHGGGSVLTNHVVTRNSNCGSVNNREGDRSLNHRVNTARFISTSCSKNIRTGLFQNDTDGIEIFSLHHHTILIPNITTIIISIVINSHHSLATGAERGVLSINECDRSKRSAHDVDLDDLCQLTTFSGGSLDHIFHTVNSSSRNGGGVGRTIETKVHSITSIVTIDSVPCIRDVLIAPAISITIECNRGTGTCKVFGSVDLKVSTDLHNIELSDSFATALHGSLHSIKASSISSQSILIIISHDTIVRSRPLIGFDSSSRIRRSSQECAATSADQTVARDQQLGSDIENDGIGIGNRNLTREVRVGGGNHNIESTFLFRSILEHVAISFSRHTVHCPSIDGGTEISILVFNRIDQLSA